MRKSKCFKGYIFFSISALMSLRAKWANRHTMLAAQVTVRSHHQINAHGPSIWADIGELERKEVTLVADFGHVGQLPQSPRHVL